MAQRYSESELLRQESEWRKCAKDPVYFVSQYALMWDKEGGDPIDWELWECQSQALKEFTKHRLCIILKTRQLGMSWTACGYAVWKMVFTSNFHVYFQSIGQKEVGEQMERIKFIYGNLPDWMRVRVSMGGRGRKENESLIQFSNGSALHTVATTKRAGHGAAPGLYIIDEFARNEKDVMTWRAVKPSLSKKGQIIVISTANGIGNTFHSLWKGAESGSNGFLPIFFPAASHPDYTPEFLAQAKEDFAGDLVGYYEAYPETPEQAFQTSSRCPFDSARIKESINHIAQQNIKPRVGRLQTNNEGQIEFEEDPKGSLMLWDEPLVGRVIEGKQTPTHHYTVGADVAEGLVIGDFSAAIVLDTNTNSVVAMYRNKIAPEHYAQQLRMLAEYFNNAWLAVEVNAHADLILDDLKASYPYLYCRERKERIYDVPTLEPGFRTTASSKPRIITQLRRSFSSQETPLKIPSKLILTEMSTFEEDDRGRLRASGSNYDDTVMALAIAIEAVNTMPKYYDDYEPPHRRYGSQSL